MKAFLTAFALIAAASCFGAAEEGSAGLAFQVHGRLSLTNGNPGFRIWIVGTKRILGIAENPPEEPMMPTKLRELMRAENFIFGDFTVVPLTNDEPGLMRMVRVVRVERIVITDGSLKFIQRIDTSLGQRATQPPEPTSLRVAASAHVEVAPI